MDELDLVGLRLLPDPDSTAHLKEAIAAGEPVMLPSDAVDTDQLEGGGLEGEDKRDGSDGGSSTSNSSSSSSSDDDDDDDESSDDSSDESGRNGDSRDSDDYPSKRVGRGIKASELEDGEIGGFEESMVAFGSDDEDEEGVAKVPIRSKHELEMQFLPPVPSVNATLEQHHQITPVGTILSVVGTKVIVQGKEQHNPLNEGSILWISESKQPLGFVDEIFGPVKAPFYVVRYNSEMEVPSGIHEGTLISYVAEFADHVLNNKDLYKKGYDASGENDEEIADEFEFSDDEKEAEVKRLQRTAKRGNAILNHSAGDFHANKIVNGKGRSRNRPSFSRGANANAIQQAMPIPSPSGVSCQPQWPRVDAAAIVSGSCSSMQITQPIGLWPNTMFVQNPNGVPVGNVNNMLQNTNQFQPYIQNNYQYPNVASLPTQFAFQPIPPNLNAVRIPSNLIGMLPPVALNFPITPMAAPHVWPASHVQPMNNEAPAAACLPTGGHPPSFEGNGMHATDFNPGRGSVGGRGKPSRQHRGNHFSSRRGRH